MPFIWRLLHFSVSFLFLFLVLCYPYFGNFLSMWSIWECLQPTDINHLPGCKYTGDQREKKSSSLNLLLDLDIIIVSMLVPKARSSFLIEIFLFKYWCIKMFYAFLISIFCIWNYSPNSLHRFTAALNVFIEKLTLLSR